MNAMPRDILAAMREIVRLAVQVLAAAPDPDRRWRGWREGWHLPAPADAAGYGYNAATAQWRPSGRQIAEAERFEPLLSWLRRRDGEAAHWRLWDWALGTPVRTLAERESVTERTIRNRLDRSLAALARAAGLAVAPVAVIEEAAPGPLRAWRAPAAPMPAAVEAPAEVLPGRVWIGGEGYYAGGRPWDDGSRLVERLERQGRA